MDISIRSNEGAGSNVPLSWDTLFDGTHADWALSDASEPNNRGGLRAKAGIETAVILALFTDARVPDSHPLRALAGDDPRGYWGDGVDVRTDLGEGPLGSLLWLLERAAITPNTLRYARSFALDALACLLTQKLCVSLDVQAVELPASNGISLSVQLYGANGARVHDKQFDILWSQI